MLDFFSQALVVGITAIIALGICLMFFQSNFTYFLYFELIFLLLFIGLSIIDYFYLSIVILVLAIIIYNAISPRLKTDDKE